MWSVIMEPVPPDPRRAEQSEVYNGGGVVVMLTDGKAKTVIGRVAYSRWRSSHRFTSFKSRLRKVIDRAEGEADRLDGRHAPDRLARRKWGT